ncbi:hypothetical protein BV25DRAFT_1919451 [Artomyces pyxidatus]|uniref:Uncharacterized protein n=1 Tax=Artomyces pyxidatus TaxID=48021 RepID=A0ACB8SQP3_9AGAM|nr:hypothetical protein BV25DRAFT_1919451 [Artomyces pyxidatus]
MSQPNKPLIGAVFERKPSSSVPAPFNSSSKTTGFPAVQHRSTSAFARGREKAKAPAPAPDRNAPPPSVQPAADWRAQVSADNERRVAAMSAEERAREKADLEEQFGQGIGDLMRRIRAAREARERQQQRAQSPVHKPVPDAHLPQLKQIETLTTVDNPSDGPMVPPAMPRSPPPTPSPILSSASTRPSSPARASRKLRFADVTPKDVYVYESAPPSPRKKALALPAPTGEEGAISLGQYKGKQPAARHPPDPPTIQPPEEDKPAEGTPEDIRRRWFPHIPAHDPSLEWIEATPPPDPGASTTRFDLKGAPIPPAQSTALPTHLGLHHHAEGTHAGYTLDDIFLLARSSVPAQRATMLGVLSKIARRLGAMRRGSDEGMPELAGKEEELRKRMLAAGVEALGEKGSVGAQAVDVVWECVVGWNEELADIDGVELQDEQPAGLPSDEDPSDKSKRDAITALPVDFVLQQIAAVFGAGALPHESLERLLSILHRLAKHTNDVASAIVETPSLIANVLKLFLLTPIPPRPDSPLPSPLALQLLTTLASSSRATSRALLDPADSLLRFITTLPPSSPYPQPLAVSLLTHTLQLYATFASYGLYSHIATTASEPFARLSTYILSPECDSRPLLTAYARLLEIWTVCATDPHQTTPEHEILWSQISSWGWAEDLLDTREKLTSDERDWGAWAALWGAQAAWLEGARVNGIKGGEGERAAVLALVKPGFDGGREKDVFLGALGGFKRALDDLADGTGLPLLRALAAHASTISATIRLWLACFPPQASEPLSEPPFQLPFSLLNYVSAMADRHPLVSEMYKDGAPPYLHVFLRPVTAFFCEYLRLSRRNPTTTDDLWLAQASVILIRAMPGDEDAMRTVLEDIVALVNEKFLSTRGWAIPSAIWERGGMRILAPFLAFAVRPTEDASLAPRVPTPHSLKHATTQRLPPAWRVQRRAHGSGLPLSRDWPLAALDHVLRSGTSPVWAQLPPAWDASETDVVRAALLLARAVREALRANGLVASALGRAEAAFACMKVFMLEHGQVQGAPGEGSDGEVFRDAAVGALMEDLLAPCVLSASADGLSAAPAAPGQSEDLEAAAARFLGPGTPFYQFYTDFVALYDAISFAHPLFAALLLPPVSQRYAVDYRKLLFHDTAHVVGTLRTPVERVVGERLGEFLWPAESDAQLIGAYLGLLLGRKARGAIEGFVRLLVVHHLAANIWPELRDSAPGPAAEDRGKKLLEAVVRQGKHEEVREVVLYWQRREGRVALPPVCFDLDGERRKGRLTWVKTWAGDDLVQRIEGLLGA